MATALQLCSLEQAKKLKETGFDWPVNMVFSKYYNSEEWYQWEQSPYDYNKGPNFVSCPTVAFALKWCREVKGICGSVEVEIDVDSKYFTVAVYRALGDIKTGLIESYDKAESALLDAILTQINAG